MQLSKEAIEEFKEIHKKVFGEEVSDKEAYEWRSRLVNFFKALLRIDIKEKNQIKKAPICL